jgi:hypothetical protein
MELSEAIAGADIVVVVDGNSRMQSGKSGEKKRKADFVTVTFERNFYCGSDSFKCVEVL